MRTDDSEHEGLVKFGVWFAWSGLAKDLWIAIAENRAVAERNEWKEKWFSHKD